MGGESEGDALGPDEGSERLECEETMEDRRPPRDGEASDCATISEGLASGRRASSTHRAPATTRSLSGEGGRRRSRLGVDDDRDLGLLRGGKLAHARVAGSLLIVVASDDREADTGDDARGRVVVDAERGRGLSDDAVRVLGKGGHVDGELAIAEGGHVDGRGFLVDLDAEADERELVAVVERVSGIAAVVAEAVFVRVGGEAAHEEELIRLLVGVGLRGGRAIGF
jgi:hypothetical protein